MKTFEHNNNTYSIQNGLLHRKDGNVWAYTPYTSDENLRIKATTNGWQGNISDDLIDNGSHSYKGKQKQIIMKNKWICTDPSCNQYRKQLDNTRFLFKEDRVINPETKETEVFEEEIDLTSLDWLEIIEACEPFGYTTEQIEKWLTEGEEFALMAECVFEMSS